MVESFVVKHGILIKGSIILHGEVITDNPPGDYFIPYF